MLGRSSRNSLSCNSFQLGIRTRRPCISAKSPCKCANCRESNTFGRKGRQVHRRERRWPRCAASKIGKRIAPQITNPSNVAPNLIYDNQSVETHPPLRWSGESRGSEGSGLLYLFYETRRRGTERSTGAASIGVSRLLARASSTGRHSQRRAAEDFGQGCLPALVFGEQDGHPGFVDETLDVLLRFAKQVALDDD